MKETLLIEPERSVIHLRNQTFIKKGGKYAREINAELLDTKIEKAQQDLVKAKHRYDAAAATLKDLLDKRDALRQKKLLDAIAQSGRSYEEIMQYLHSKSEEV